MTATTPHAGRHLAVTERWTQALAGWELELQAADRPATPAICAATTCGVWPTTSQTGCAFRRGCCGRSFSRAPSCSWRSGWWVAALVAPVVVRVVFSPDAVPSIAVALILAGASVVGGIAQLLQTALVSRGGYRRSGWG